jgi:hypothetical protein
MRLVVFCAAVAAAMVCFASPAAALPLWQNVDSDMTVAQIRAAQPEAEPDPAPGTLNNGARCELTIPSLAIGADTYKVCFYMLGGKLHQVTLTAKSPNRPRFESTVDLLRGKYGADIGAGQPLCRPGLMTICEAKWLLKTGVNVDAVFLQVGSNEPLVNINYQTRMAADASKL